VRVWVKGGERGIGLRGGERDWVKVGFVRGLVLRESKPGIDE
jgi:hypothetical protein